jgi:superfamily I DNA and/or RNA helicase
MTQNTREVQAVVHIVKHSYRTKQFAVITPYDGQRAAIQAELRRENLPWENVFNVDSFQGAPYPTRFTLDNL